MATDDSPVVAPLDNKINAPSSTLATTTSFIGADTWRPSRPGTWRTNLRFDDLNERFERLRRRIITLPTTGVVTPTNPNLPAGGQPGAPQQLLSLSAYQTASKQQDRTYSLVSISFSPTPGDTNFGGVRIWFTGYKGSTTPQLMSEGQVSPLSFLAEATQETVVVTGVPYALGGAAAPFTGAKTTTLTLSGVVSAPPAPSITQILTTVPGGFQFSFALEGGLLADVIDSYKVYRNTINDSSTATVIQTIKHPQSNNGDYTVQDYPGGDLIEFYWVSAVNTVGLESSLTAAQSSTNQALALNYSFGNSFASNAGFEVNNIVLPLGTAVTTVNYPICDGWILGRNDNNIFAAYNDNGFGRNSSKALLIRLNQGVSIPNGTSFCQVFSTVKFPIQTDDWAGWRCYYNILSNAALPAGISVQVATGVRLYDNVGAWVASLFTNVASPVFDSSYHQIAETQQQVYTNVAYCVPFLQVFVVNTGGSVSTGVHLYADVRWDDTYFFLQAPTNNGSPQTAAYTPNTQPLTATTLVSTSTIHIAAYTVTYPFGSVSYSSATIGGLLTSTKYYVVGSDRGYAGGAITYQATTNNPTVNSNEAYLYLGFITTPASGGGSTGGSGGGGGACFTPQTKLWCGNRMSDIQVGDRVWVERADGEKVLRPVSKVLVHDYDGLMYVIEGDQLVTPRHRFRVDGQWIPAEQFLTETVHYKGKVRNLHIDTEDEEERNYVLANGLAGHNVSKL